MTEYTLHKFRASETIDAVMRLKGRHDYTREEILVLRIRFNELNGLVVPRPGDEYKIPLEASLVARLVDVPVVSGPGSDGEKPADNQEGTDPHQEENEIKAEPVP